jgi:hypothetical protein
MGISLYLKVHVFVRSNWGRVLVLFPYRCPRLDRVQHLKCSSRLLSVVLYLLRSPCAQFVKRILRNTKSCRSVSMFHSAVVLQAFLRNLVWICTVKVCCEFHFGASPLYPVLYAKLNSNLSNVCKTSSLNEIGAWLLTKIYNFYWKLFPYFVF